MVPSRRLSEICDVEAIIKVNVIILMVIKVRIPVFKKRELVAVVVENHYCLVSNNQQETSLELEASW